MPIPIQDNRKVFEVPNSGPYIGVVADVVDLGKKDRGFGLKPMIRIVWLLNAKDSEGNFYRVVSEVNASANKKSALYGIVKGVLGAVPAPPFDAEILIGRSNQLFVVKEQSKKDPNKWFANVKVILPLPDGTSSLAIPPGFVRYKDQPARQAAPQATPQPPQTATAASAVSAPNTAVPAASAAVAVAEEDIPF